MLVKICGMKDPENVREIAGLQPDMMGFIFYSRSPRYAGDLKPGALQNLSSRIKRVGVFVNETSDQILEVAQLYNLSMIQLHGDEKPELCKTLRRHGLQIIKAISIQDPEDFRIAANYQEDCDYLLFDTKSNRYGGTGKAFNWDLLYNYHSTCPFLLSGGISAQNAGQLKQINHPRFAGVDLNSCFELSPGYKNRELLDNFLQTFNSVKGRASSTNVESP